MEPFLASLAVHGIQVGVGDYRRIATALRAEQRWTLAGLRTLLTALLARNRDQARDLPRWFDRFFQRSQGVADAGIDRERVLAELRGLLEGPPARPQQQATPPAIPKPGKPKDPNRFPRWLAGLLAVVALVGMVAIAGLLRSDDDPVPVEVIAVEPPPTPAPAEPVPIPNGLFHHPELSITKVRYAPDQAWRTPAAVAAASLLALLFYAVWVWRRVRIPKLVKPAEASEKPRLFSIAEVGGEPAPRFAPDELDAVADALGHSLSLSPGDSLDSEASIRATLEHQGIPELVFHHRRQPRGLLLLLDEYSEAAQWNPVAEELAAGMATRGVALSFGRFRGDPTQFTPPEGRRQQLEDWEERRASHLLLVFSDGRGLAAEQRGRVMEQLRHWLRVAWFDPREPRAWDGFSRAPVEAGIPVYPATPAGVLAAVRRYLSEASIDAQVAAGGDGDYSAAELPMPPRRARMGLDAYLEQTLGEALPWAQACALVQPIPPGLAERLREEFFAELPAAAIERLYTLPGSDASVAGLHFSMEVQRALRRGLRQRWTEARRRRVIDFLVAQIDQAKPDNDPDSLRYLAWERARELQRFEADPNQVRRLAELAQTELGAGIEDQLARQRALAGTERWSETTRALEPRARAWLAGIGHGIGQQRRDGAGGDPLGLGRIHHQPIGASRWGVAVTLLTAMLLSALWSHQQWRTPPTQTRVALDWEVSGEAPGGLYTLIQERLPGGEWQERVALPGLPDVMEVAAWDQDREYRLALVVGGDAHPLVWQQLEPAERLRFELDWTHSRHDCIQPTGLPGLRRQDCSLTRGQDPERPRSGWRRRLGADAPADRALSVALALDGGEGRDDPLADALLISRSVDRVYNLDSSGDSAPDLEDALARIAEDLGPALAHAQFLVYEVGTVPSPKRRVILANALDGTGWSRWLLLAPPVVGEQRPHHALIKLLYPSSWHMRDGWNTSSNSNAEAYQALWDIAGRGEATDGERTPFRLVSESQILDVFKGAALGGRGSPMVLVGSRSDKKVERQNRVALVIGNGNYRGTSALRSPVNNARDMTEALIATGFTVITIVNGDYRMMMGAIEELSQSIKGHGTTMVYYSGHAVQVDGENYLVPVDADVEDKHDALYESVPLSYLFAKLKLNTARFIMVLDASRANPYVHSVRSAKGGLARVDIRAGSIVAFAAAPGAVVLDGSGNNSPYTRSLTRHIRQPGLEIHELFRNVRADVMRDTGGEQIPWEIWSMIDDFYFIPPR